LPLRKKFLVPENISQSNVANPKLGTENWEQGTRRLPSLYNVEPDKHNPHRLHEARFFREDQQKMPHLSKQKVSPVLPKMYRKYVDLKRKEF
jgi:hypothetical protein